MAEKYLIDAPRMGKKAGDPVDPGTDALSLQQLRAGGVIGDAPDGAPEANPRPAATTKPAAPEKSKPATAPKTKG